MKFKTLSIFLKKHPVFLVTLFYVLITLIMSFPVIFKISREIPIWQSDTYQVVGTIQQEINIFHAQGMGRGLVGLAKGFQINIFLPYALLGFFLGKILAYNLLFFFSFIMSALGAYLLAYYFTRSRLGSFLAGLIYAFAPFHFYHSLSTHVGTMHEEWIPFFVLFLFKFFEDFRFKNFLLAALFSLLIAGSDQQLLAFTVVFVAVFVIYKFITEPKKILKNKKFLAYVSVAAVFLIVIIYAFFAPYLKVATSDNNFLNAGLRQAERYSISPINPLIPAAKSSLWPNLHDFLISSLKKISLLDISKVGEKESSTFLSYTGIILMILATVSFWKAKENDYFKKNKKTIIFWLVSLFVFYIFSIGPTIEISKNTVYMPYYLVYEHLPFYENIRTVGRFFVFALLSASILASYGFVFLAQKFPAKKIILAGFVSAIILIEFMVAPIPTTTLAYSPFYDQVAKEPGNFKLLEIPGSTSYDFASFQMMTSAITGKQVVNGIAMARVIKHQFDFQQNTPVLSQLLYSLPKGNTEFNNTNSKIIQSNYFGEATDILNYYGIRYITVQKNFMSAKKIGNAENFIRQNIAIADTYEDKDLIAFEVSQKAPQGFYADVMDNAGWSAGKTDKSSKNIYRPTADGASMQLVNMENAPENINLSFIAQSDTPEKLSVQDRNGKELSNFEINNSWNNFQMNFTAIPGDNNLVFKLFDSAGNEIKDRKVNLANFNFTGK